MDIYPEGAEEDLGLLYRALAEQHLAPLWPISDQLMTPRPRPRAVPWMWRWKDVLTLAEEAGELVTIERGGDRRVLSLANPGLPGTPFATSTLWGAYQYLNAGEHAPAHRHSPGAIRFVIQGRGVHTTVNGDALTMAPGDLILTPSMNWHDHNSESDEPMVWFDGLDMPAVLALDAMFFEEYPGDRLQPVEGRNRSEGSFAAAGLLPADRSATPGGHSSLYAYRWEQTDAALQALLERRGGPMVTLEFCDPVTGGPALPTLGCQMHRLVPPARTPTQRMAGSRIFLVHRGAGTTVIDGVRFRWEAGDSIVVPSWAAVDHQADESADLFSISDEPMLRALHLHRETTLDTQQDVHGDFAAEAPGR